MYALLLPATGTMGTGTCPFYDELGEVVYPDYPLYVATCASYTFDENATQEMKDACCKCLSPFPSEYNGIYYCIANDTGDENGTGEEPPQMV